MLLFVCPSCPALGIVKSVLYTLRMKACYSPSLLESGSFQRRRYQ